MPSFTLFAAVGNLLPPMSQGFGAFLFLLVVTPPQFG